MRGYDTGGDLRFHMNDTEKRGNNSVVIPER